MILYITDNLKEKRRRRRNRRLDGLQDQLFWYMNLCPVPFNTKGKTILENVKRFMDSGKLAIDPLVHSELLADLRTATANEEMLLDALLFNFLFWIYIF